MPGGHIGAEPAVHPSGAGGGFWGEFARYHVRGAERAFAIVGISYVNCPAPISRQFQGRSKREGGRQGPGGGAKSAQVWGCLLEFTMRPAARFSSLPQNWTAPGRQNFLTMVLVYFILCRSGQELIDLVPFVACSPGVMGDGARAHRCGMNSAEAVGGRVDCCAFGGRAQSAAYFLCYSAGGREAVAAKLVLIGADSGATIRHSGS